MKKKKNNQDSLLNETTHNKINTLFYKKKKLISSYYQHVPIKDNFILLRRRNGDTDFFEGIKSGEFEYEHSDGSIRKILLKPIWLSRMKFLDNDARGYFCDEDMPIPYGADPLPFMIDEFEATIAKVQRDEKAWKDSKISHTERSIKALVPLVLVIAGAFILYKLVVAEPTVIVQNAPEIAKQTAQNLSNSGVLG